MKLLDNITAELVMHNSMTPLRVPHVPRFALGETTLDTQSLDMPEYFRWRVGVTVFNVFEGPKTGKAHYLKTAKRMIAREVYGEILDDLFVLTRLLHEEGPRLPGDKVSEALHALIRKISDQETGA